MEVKRIEKIESLGSFPGSFGSSQPRSQLQEFKGQQLSAHQNNIFILKHCLYAFSVPKAFFKPPLGNDHLFISFFLCYINSEIDSIIEIFFIPLLFILFYLLLD